MKIELKYAPVKDVYITQPFGVNYCDFYASMGLKGHNGIDFRAFRGCPVIATHDGTVTWAGADGNGGISVQILSSKQGEGFYTVNYHLLDVTIKVGDDVKAGKLIGHADNTGLFTTGDHDHFGLKRTFNGATIDKDNGYSGAIDPAPYFPKDWDKSNAYKRYGRNRAFLSEVKVMIALRAYLKRLPTSEEINACTYGAWDREVLKNDAMGYNWKYLTKKEFNDGKKPFC